LDPHTADSRAVDFSRDSHGLIGIGGTAEIEEKLIKFSELAARQEKIARVFGFFSGAFPYPQNEGYIKKNDPHIDNVQAPDIHDDFGPIPILLLGISLNVNSQPNSPKPTHRTLANPPHPSFKEAQKRNAQNFHE
jgi:hypothetical protein